MSIVRSSKHLDAQHEGTRHLVVPSITGALALLILGGCASSTTRPDARAIPSTPTPVMYTVERGDRLGDIAEKFTGAVDSWRAIADANNIDDPRRLHVGTVIEIPADLIAQGNVARGDAADTPVMTTKGASKNTSVAVSSHEIDAAQTSSADTRIDRMHTRPVPVVLATRRVAPEEVSATPAVKLNAVDVNRRFELSPLNGVATQQREDDGSAVVVRSNEIVEPRSTDTPLVTGSRTQQVRVLGSYFPKGIYAQPASYSELIMRVAPGTLFVLEKRVGDWYGVITDQGIGYLRDTDVRVLDASDGTAAARRG